MLPSLHGRPESGPAMVEEGRDENMMRKGNSLYREAIRCQNGGGVPKDWKRAFTLMSEAAAVGHIRAQGTLGSYYYYGIGVRPDRAKAFRNYEAAALAGDSDAQYDLGLCYRDAVGTRRNHRLAVRWVRKSAERGTREAIHALRSEEHTSELQSLR